MDTSIAADGAIVLLVAILFSTFFRIDTFFGFQYTYKNRC